MIARSQGRNQKLDCSHMGILKGKDRKEKKRKWKIKGGCDRRCRSHQEKKRKKKRKKSKKPEKNTEKIQKTEKNTEKLTKNKKKKGEKTKKPCLRTKPKLD